MFERDSRRAVGFPSDLLSVSAMASPTLQPSLTDLSTLPLLDYHPYGYDWHGTAAAFAAPEYSPSESCGAPGISTPGEGPWPALGSTLETTQDIEYTAYPTLPNPPSEVLSASGAFQPAMNPVSNF